MTYSVYQYEDPVIASIPLHNITHLQVLGVSDGLIDFDTHRHQRIGRKMKLVLVADGGGHEAAT